jgi:hypothetical protein
MIVRGDLSVQETVFGIVSVICMTVIFVTIIITERKGKK